MDGWSNTQVDQHIIVMGSLHTSVIALSTHISFYIKIYICILRFKLTDTYTATHQLYGDMN